MTSTARQAVRTLLGCVLALFLAGCFRGYGQPDNPFNESQGAGGEISIRVDNQNFQDVTLYALRGGEPMRLGDIIGKSTGRFTVDWNFSLPLEFRAEMVGGGSCNIRSLNVDPGDRVWVRIPVNLGITPCESGK